MKNKQTNKHLKTNTKSSTGEQTSFFNYSYLMAAVVAQIHFVFVAHKDKIDLIFKKDLLRYYNSY